MNFRNAHDSLVAIPDVDGEVVREKRFCSTTRRRFRTGARNICRWGLLLDSMQEHVRRCNDARRMTRLGAVDGREVQNLEYARK